MIDANEPSLNEHLNEESRQELLEERIEDYARGLMEQGQEYYPFAPSLLTEAIMEMKEGELRVFAACLAEAVKNKLSDNLTNHLALISLVNPVKEYVLGLAMVEARRYVE